MENKFRENLMQIRAKKGISLQELENRTGIGANRIWHYEKGTHEPKVTNILRLAEGLECGVEELLG